MSSKSKDLSFSQSASLLNQSSFPSVLVKEVTDFSFFAVIRLRVQRTELENSRFVQSQKAQEAN